LRAGDGCEASVSPARVKLRNEPVEGISERGIVLLRVRLHELDYLVAVGGLQSLTASLIHHAEAIVAVVYVGEAHEELASGAFGFIELGRRVRVR